MFSLSQIVNTVTSRVVQVGSGNASVITGVFQIHNFAMENLTVKTNLMKLIVTISFVLETA